MLLSLSLRKQRENPWGLSRPALTAAVHSAEGTGSPLRASFHPHHPQSGFVPFTPLHGLTQVSLQIWSRYHHWDTCSLPLSPAFVPAVLVPQSQLDTALPTALSSLRAIMINDFQPQSTFLWGSGDCEGPTSRLLLPASPGQMVAALVLSQGAFKSRV